jgi:hypothetical protein
VCDRRGPVFTIQRLWCEEAHAARAIFSGAQGRACREGLESCTVATLSEEKIPENVEAIARQAWDSAQRIAMQIAGIAAERREAAFNSAVRAMKESAAVHGMSDAQRDGWIVIQMNAIREMAKEIDASGQPQGGHA